MRQFRTLLGYEIKKIFCRKSTWITFAVLLSAYLFSLIMTWSMTYKSVSKEQDDSGKVVSEEWKESYAQKKAREKENGLYWSGRKIDNALLADAAKEYREVMEKTDMHMVEGIGLWRYEERMQLLAAKGGIAFQTIYLSVFRGILPVN